MNMIDRKQLKEDMLNILQKHGIYLGQKGGEPLKFVTHDENDSISVIDIFDERTWI
jgi:hypothetical protein